mmetsp:Transcript_12687/g.22439  ORF Transcript_12687/g.22439 Transcript_12687/m.22439 type:complete len:229 (-) Transcript_12687:96-782(-)|eukprot:CAMPEP_0197633720 /NCGR_PEP_ID=MMETSP1338-20131121/10022_1 /TAXON_ID=43686 ORGANISM="Pelagodinium beii, Strain RCC1491" /NCGR_SAMPLE_ID=MMETSP1338 /ASSEMBLY_ACC=CAM_ASM_000754 /LENGTH=228 /DNA_ID=CAMNT_0043205443 /DNA_START=34 /DNA_END=720 /DNA_ORIENTATION=-
MALAACEPLQGQASLAGVWNAVSENRQATWPKECWSKGEDGSWLLFGRRLRGFPLFQNIILLPTKFKIDPFLSRLQGQLHSVLWMDLPLDGSQKDYVPFIQVAGTARLRCTSKSYSEIHGEALWADQTAFRWKLELDEGGERCKLQIQHMETAAVVSHYFERVPPSTFPSFRQVFTLSRENDKIAAMARAQVNPSLETVMENRDSVHRDTTRFGCFPWRAMRKTLSQM